MFAGISPEIQTSITVKNAPSHASLGFGSRVSKGLRFRFLQVVRNGEIELSSVVDQKTAVQDTEICHDKAPASRKHVFEVHVPPTQTSIGTEWTGKVKQWRWDQLSYSSDEEEEKRSL